MNLRSLPQRFGTSLVIVIGIGGVVAVLVSMLAMATGMIKTMETGGREDRAIVTFSGATSETASALTRQAAQLVVDAPGIKHDAEGRPVASIELVRAIKVFRKDDNSSASAIIRGVGAQAGLMRPELKIIEGRMFNPAVNEVIVGKGVRSQFRDLEVDSRIATRTATWMIVGTFESGGDAHESEMQTDTETLMSAFARNRYSSVTVLLESKDAFQKFVDHLTSNPAISVDVNRERDYFARQSETVTRLLSVIAYLIGGIMAVGAIFGALNTMYSAVSTKSREIGTLRALGFGSTAIVTAIMAEALLLATVGGLIGASLAWMFFNGNAVSSTVGGVVATQLVFDIAISPQLIVVGIIWAGCIGLIGGLFPAIRAARLPIATALRS